jgi:helicase SWR1
MDKAVESGDTMDEFTIETISKLHTLLRPFILRRLKSEVETQLPGKFEHVVYCKLSKRQRFLYDEFMSRASTKEALVSGGYLGVMNTLMQLRKVCNHPDLFEVRQVRTSFAMEKSVAGEYSPVEVLVRRLLNGKGDELCLEGMRLNVTAREGESGWAAMARNRLDGSGMLPCAVEEVTTRKVKKVAPPPLDTRTVDGWLKYQDHVKHEAEIARWRSLWDINKLRCAGGPVYGSTFLDMLRDVPSRIYPETSIRKKKDLMDGFVPPAAGLVLSLPDRAKIIEPLIERYAVIPPNVVALDLPSLALPDLNPHAHSELLNPDFDTLHHASTKLQIAFPDASLLQYDCGKLQVLYTMLRDLKLNSHRVLIFTQMTRVLDILEMFLSYNGHRYLRLDGSTKIEDRQIITERFNSDPRIFVFIASSRSGGVGINLTGADTVFFYDSDWNPSMDRQCMDRAHRIGQTREVHIYRFVSSFTVEENMLKKANQKRLLDRVVIQEGDFTTDFLGKMDWRDLLGDEKAKAQEGERGEDEEGVRVEDGVEDEEEAVEVDVVAPRIGAERDIARALAEVEDEEDVAAARIAQGEGDLDLAEFGENRAKAVGGLSVPGISGEEVPTTLGGEKGQDGDIEMEEEEEDGEVGGIDEYMLRTVEWDWDWFASL